MKKYLAILLLLVLPMQIAWAAAGSLCKHESGAAAQHFGHQDHKHQCTNSDAVSGDSSSSPAGSDADCGLCHGGTSSVLPENLTLALHWTATPLPRSGFNLLPPPLADRPERPQWLHLA